MMTIKRLLQASLAIGAFTLVGVGAARAQISTERPGSILIFPKVINASDTLIQITNTSNTTAYAHCYYINGATVQGRTLWQITDFDRHRKSALRRHID